MQITGVSNQGSKCVNHHAVPVNAMFCPWCGVSIGLKVSPQQAPVVWGELNGPRWSQSHGAIGCPNGHAVGAYTKFCNDCGLAVPVDIQHDAQATLGNQIAKQGFFETRVQRFP